MDYTSPSEPDSSRSPSPESWSQSPIESLIRLHPNDKPSYWNIVLGHASRHTLKNMKVLKDADFNADCIACLKAKTHRQPHYLSTGFRSSRPLELIHFDLCGPFSPFEKDHNEEFI